MNPVVNPISNLLLLNSGNQISIDPNIALGDTFLTTNAKVRAYWNFTGIAGNDGDVLTSYNDLSLSGTWDLTNSVGANNPKLGKIQDGTDVVSCLRAKTASTIREAFITTLPAVNLLKNSVECHFLMKFEDGQNASSNIFFGSSNGGTQFFRLRVTSTGRLQLEYAAAAAGLSTILSDTVVIENGETGVYLIRLRLDFTTDVVSGMVNGIPITFSVSSGNAISAWNPANWTSNTRECGIGGEWSGSFVADTSTRKYILKSAVSDLLTSDEYLILAASFLNY